MRKQICFTLFSLVAVAFLPATGTIAGESDKQKPAEKEVQIDSLVVKGGLPESTGRFGFFGDVRMDLRKLISRLDKAASDARLVGVVLRIRNPVIGRGRLAELRAAVSRVRKAGKKVYADLQLATPVDYLLACACDHIIMPESGTLMIPGVRAEITFYKTLFDVAGVQADMMQVGSHKGTAEPYTRSSMSDEFREQYEQLLTDFYDQLIETIAQDRKLPLETVKKLVDQGLFSAKQALDAGLIDEIAYGDQIKERLSQDLKTEAAQIDVMNGYAIKKVENDFSGLMGMVKLFDLLLNGDDETKASKNKKVAVIYAVGSIVTGESALSLFGGATVGSDTLIRALKQADDD